MNLPWMRFHTRDWLDNKELRRCSPISRAILADLMCLAHEGVPYGHLSDKAGPLDDRYMAARCFVTVAQFNKAIEDLLKFERIARSESGLLSIPRMVEDERVRLARAEGGSKGGNPNLLNQEVGGKVNLPDNHKVKVLSRARTRADSDSGSCSQKFSEFWKKYPRKFGESEALGDWVSVVTEENEAAVFACLDRYLASDEVGRGVVMSAGSTMRDIGWLVKCSRDGWACEWPTKARDQPPSIQVPTYRRIKFDANGDVIDA